jgi:hypothetical protein
MSKRLNGSIVNYTPRQPHTHSRRDSSRPCESLFFVFYFILFYCRKFVHFPPAGERWTFPKKVMLVLDVYPPRCAMQVLVKTYYILSSTSAWMILPDQIITILSRWRVCSFFAFVIVVGVPRVCVRRPPFFLNSFSFFYFRPSSVAMLPSHHRLFTAVCQKHWRYACPSCYTLRHFSLCGGV